MDQEVRRSRPEQQHYEVSSGKTMNQDPEQGVVTGLDLCFVASCSACERGLRVCERVGDDLSWAMFLIPDPVSLQGLRNMWRQLPGLKSESSVRCLCRRRARDEE